ncbi:hypothetical protein MKN04_02860 [Paenibacillus polymyxa]|uniref:hypothetical protein n=1 Tax=Paenibacillus polymyxa TaxID=1406 RepID=UPI001E56443E|nr:hypothetical protein [Paenibacillus polymyxa]MCH6186601.1 hypothetical protein [Paenibacillus polymyxa]WRL60417.1 hypothetical protein U3G77_20120 [Paenibacillus polymyxa]
MSEDENLFHTYYSAVESVIEKASVQILASYLTSDTKWGLFNGFSSRPMMPITAKMLFSKEVLKEDARLIQQLKVSSWSNYHFTHRCIIRIIYCISNSFAIRSG